ncbi:MAG: tetratricopeptide repeat protein [Chitinophagaceae bacterium]
MKNLFSSILLISLIFSCKDDKKEPITTINTKTISIPESVKAVIDAAKKDSTNTDLQLQVVTALDSLGLYKEALLKIDKLITNDSLNNTFWLKRGLICKQIGDTAAAIKAFRYSAKIYPTPTALMELANLYAETKNIAALNISKQLMQMNPGGDYNAQAYLLAGIYYAKIGEKLNALKLFDKSISEDFHLSEAYLEKGYLLYEETKYKEALQNFIQLSQINQSYADAYYWIGKCSEALNDRQKAIDSYQKSLQLDSSIKEATIAIERLKKTK